MSKSLSEVENKSIGVAEVVHYGEKLIVPEGMDLDTAINLMNRRKTFLQEEVSFQEVFDAFPYDGAVALDTVLTRRYGWSPAEGVETFFGKIKPQMIGVEVRPGVHKSVPWGKFSLPNITGSVSTGASRKDGRVTFAISADVLRQDEATVRALFNEIRQELKTNSIYRGQAIKMRFRDDDGDLLEMPEPKFINTTDIDPSMLVYSRDVQAAVETNLFTPIQRVTDCLKNGIEVKRGVLLGGTYGTGKTMAAKVASKLAVEAGITYLYVPRADELADALEFAKQYQSPACVIFCEDIDRVMDGERSVEMDDILNIIDGVDTKSTNVIVVLTTNDLTAINAAMLRPGRLDAVIDVTPPDAEAVEKLLRLYMGDALAPDTDLSEVGEALAGNIPAVIAEVTKRSKLAQLRLQAPGEAVRMISEEALLEAARSMTSQMALLKAQSEKGAEKPTIDSLLREMLDKSVEENSSSGITVKLG